MSRRALGGVALGLVLMVGLASAQVGRPVPAPASDLEGFSQTEAKSFGDFVGRAVLIEFFAFW